MSPQCRKRVAFTVLCATIASIGSAAHGQQAPAITPGPDGVVFAIGVEEGSSIEFALSGWKGIDTFECTVGIDCVAKTFPGRLHAAWAKSTWDSTAVARVLINFNLATDIPNAVFREARFGTETDVVRVDDGPEIVVAGAGEDRLGHFEAPLGALRAGPHQIALSVAKDKIGSGRHSLDAIALMSR